TAARHLLSAGRRPSLGASRSGSMSTCFESPPVGCLLRAVTADRHATPPPGMAVRVIGEEQRTSRAFAGLHVGKLLRENEPSQRLSDRKQKRVGVTPAAHGLKVEGGLLLWPLGDPREGLVALEETIEWLQLGERHARQGVSHSPAHEAPEPFS